MSTLFNRIGTRYTNYMVHQGRNQARRVLLSQSDATLEDLGISRGLLDNGVKAWPWTTTIEQPLPTEVVKSRYNRREEQNAIRELRALSDRELRDIGISRGEIIDAVKYGKSGRNEANLPAFNLTVLAKQSIGTASEDLNDSAANAVASNTAAA